MASGGGLKQTITNPAGLPGLQDSCYSAKQTISITSNGSTVITDVGELLFMPTAANVSVELQESAGVWTAILTASQTNAHQFFSDGTNLRFKSADTSTTRTGTYYVIQ